MIVGQLVALGGLGAQDTREMPGIVAGQLGFAAVNPVYKESPPRQGAIVQRRYLVVFAASGARVAKPRLWTGGNACPTMKLNL